MKILHTLGHPAQQPCDYAKLATQQGKIHGPAVINRRGYNICQFCYDAMVEAERQEEEAYKALNEQYAIDEHSRALQRRCFL